MQYLLDTHAILWYVDANANLSLSLRDTIDSADCFYSVASLWGRRSYRSDTRSNDSNVSCANALVRFRSRKKNSAFPCLSAPLR